MTGDALVMYALVNDQGTAMSETALCGRCYFWPSNRVAAKRAAGIAPDAVNVPHTFTDCTLNDELACQACGDTVPESAWLACDTPTPGQPAS